MAKFGLFEVKELPHENEELRGIIECLMDVLTMCGMEGVVLIHFHTDNGCQVTGVSEEPGLPELLAKMYLASVEVQTVGMGREN